MEIIWVAVINGFFGILIFIGGLVLNGKIKTVSKTMDDTQAAVHETKLEVKNSHTVNFREDMDSKFSITNGLIEEVRAELTHQGRATIQLRKSLANHIMDTLKRENDIIALIEEHHPAE